MVDEQITEISTRATQTILQSSAGAVKTGTFYAFTLSNPAGGIYDWSVEPANFVASKSLHPQYDE